ncbi:MAG: 50S ribosomal protein L5 [Acidimicrobiia bacterium]|nr:50S ribosomal protein L5 [Acidimicrobiia bacterium]
MAAATKYIPRMKAHYLNTVRADLMSQLELKNPMQVPTIEKIVINMGVGRATQQASLLDGAVADLTAITGQKPLVTKSRIAIASFKLRENQAIGCKVTMRGDRMWEFFDRMLSIAIPRIRDFRGLSGSDILFLRSTLELPHETHDFATDVALARFAVGHESVTC